MSGNPQPCRSEFSIPTLRSAASCLASVVLPVPGLPPMTTRSGRSTGQPYMTMLCGYAGIAYANPRLTQSKLSGIDRDKTTVPIASLLDRPLKNQGAPSARGADGACGLRPVRALAELPHLRVAYAGDCQAVKV